MLKGINIASLKPLNLEESDTMIDPWLASGNSASKKFPKLIGKVA